MSRPRSLRLSWRGVGCGPRRSAWYWRPDGGAAGGWPVGRARGGPAGGAPAGAGVYVAAASCVAFFYLPANGATLLLLVSVAHASVLAPIIPIADALALGRQRGAYRGAVSIRLGAGAGSAAFIIGTLLAGPAVAGGRTGGDHLVERDAAGGGRVVGPSLARSGGRVPRSSRASGPVVSGRCCACRFFAG